jgi:hypothetical protein
MRPLVSIWMVESPSLPVGATGLGGVCWGMLENWLIWLPTIDFSWAVVVTGGRLSTSMPASLASSRSNSSLMSTRDVLGSLSGWMIRFLTDDGVGDELGAGCSCIGAAMGLFVGIGV